jgi:FkbM family methyltransferase
MVELGSYWAFYALWFMEVFPEATVALLEPDPDHLEVGALNLALNGRTATVFQAAVGATSAPEPFECDDGRTIDVPRMTLDDVQRQAGIDRADLVLADIQGGETELLEQALPHLARTVRFLVVSTHAGIGPSGEDRHDHCLAMLRSCGAHVIAEHTIEESFSGDGLIAVSFDPRDRDLVVPVSRARSRDAVLFEPSKAEWRARAAHFETSLASAREYVVALEDARERAETYAAALQAERAAPPVV